MARLSAAQAAEAAPWLARNCPADISVAGEQSCFAAAIWGGRMRSELLHVQLQTRMIPPSGAAAALGALSGCLRTARCELCSQDRIRGWQPSSVPRVWNICSTSFCMPLEPVSAFAHVPYTVSGPWRTLQECAAAADSHHGGGPAAGRRTAAQPHAASVVARIATQPQPPARAASGRAGTACTGCGSCCGVTRNVR